jgi:tetratricopeptide (TPR) repeat protein
MRANWDRHDHARIAPRNAAPSRQLDHPASANRNDRQVNEGVSKIATQVLGGPILAHLYDMRAHVAAGRWKNVMGSFRQCLPTLRRLDPPLLERIVRILYEASIRKGAKSSIAALASMADPLAMDPRWHRARAMSAEHPKNGDLDEAEKHWLAYLDDLAGMECLSPAERSLAQALVWERIGAIQLAKYRAVPPPFRGLDDSVVERQSRAMQCLENSLRLAPDRLLPYEALAGIHIEREEHDEAANAYRRLLERFPENVDALVFLANHHLRRDEHLQAHEYALGAHRLKPANRAMIELMWTVHVGSARQYALRKEWDKGRAEFAAADELQPSERDAYYLLARKALFELKARNFELGEELVERAKSQAGEPTPALLVLAIESIRYDLSRTVRSSFHRQWKAALKKRCRSRTAGLMSTTLASYLRWGVDYPGWSDHVRQLLAYVRRTSRVKWQRDDFRKVCDFLDAATDRREFSEEIELLEHLVRKGVRKFPEDPVFWLQAGHLELGKGPMRCDRRYAHRCFQRAAELAKDSNDPAAADVGERATQGLSFLEDIGLDPPEFGFGPRGGPFTDLPPDDSCEDDVDFLDRLPPGELFKIFVEACAERGLDPEEVLDNAARGGPMPVRLPRRPSRGGRKKKKKTR